MGVVNNFIETKHSLCEKTFTFDSIISGLVDEISRVYSYFLKPLSNRSILSNDSFAAAVTLSYSNSSTVTDKIL